MGLGVLWERASLYLPIAVMGGLALLSYWVLRSAPPPEAPAVERPVSHHPDYFMRGFAVRTFNGEGQLQSEVFGREARHYPDTDLLEIEQARLRSIGTDGQETTATARQVTVNAAHTDYQLMGQVQVIRPAMQQANGQFSPSLSFSGEALRVRTDERTISSDLPVTLLRGKDRLTANRLHYNDNNRVAVLQGQVHTTLAPRY